MTDNVQSPTETKRRWPRWARRGVMEHIAVALIILGVVMLVQPFSIALYGWSFTVVLAGTAMFTIVSKFPE
ncbi:MAG: hypothetical protein R3D05_01405 [Dongiaceae bacterium]